MTTLSSIILSLCSSLCLASCAHHSAIDSEGTVTIRQSSSFIRHHGTRQFQHLQRTKKTSLDPRYTERVNRVAEKLQTVIQLPKAEWEFIVFKDSSPNAFCLPGGKVGINTGLFNLADDDALLAAVLGHEISHATSNHACQKMVHALAHVIGGAILYHVLENNDVDHPEQALIAYTLATYLLDALPLSRRQEYESDRVGMIFMAQSGYDPRRAIELWEKLSRYHRTHGSKKPGFLLTHPSNQSRIRSLRAFLPIAMAQYEKSKIKNQK